MQEDKITYPREGTDCSSFPQGNFGTQIMDKWELHMWQKRADVPCTAHALRASAAQNTRAFLCHLATFKWLVHSLISLSSLSSRGEERTAGPPRGRLISSFS